MKRFSWAMLVMALVLGLALAGCGGAQVETFDVSTAAELKAAFASITGSGDYLININAPLTTTEATTLDAAGANVTVKGASASTTITSSANGVFYAQAGKITLENIRITGGGGLVAVGTATMEIKNGVSVIGNGSTQGIFMGNTATLIMSGGTVEGFGAGLLASSWREFIGKVTISGGIIRNCGAGIVLLENTSNSTFTISGGTITATQKAIEHQGSGNTINITGGTFSSGDGAGIELGGSNASVTISGGKLSGSRDGLVIFGFDINVTVSGGEITGSSGAVIYGSNNTVAINGGALTGTVDYGVDVREGSGHTVTKTRGTVTGVNGPYNDDTGTAAITGF